MASIRRHGRGWRAEVSRRGVRRSRVFPTRQAAKDWAARQEYEILHHDEVAAKTTLDEVLERYAREVSPRKRGHRWEAIRLEKFRRDPIARLQMRELRPEYFAQWRDARLREVSPGTVIREMQLFSTVLNTARLEWGLISSNPLSDVRRPSPPPPRDRLPTEDEIERMRHVAGEDLRHATARAFHAFLFALETAMRAGEIVGLTWDRIDLEKRVAHLARTKNGRPRDVPLSSEAVRLLEALPRMEPVFGLSSQQLDVLFRKVRDRAGVTDLTFHDSRHAAITRLAKKLDVLALARMVGHRDLRMLQVYHNESAEEIAKRLG